MQILRVEGIPGDQELLTADELVYNLYKFL